LAPAKKWRSVSEGSLGGGKRNVESRSFRKVATDQASDYRNQGDVQGASGGHGGPGAQEVVHTVPECHPRTKVRIQSEPWS